MLLFGLRSAKRRKSFARSRARISLIVAITDEIEDIETVDKMTDRQIATRSESLRGT
jgi:hypothetical protein